MNNYILNLICSHRMCDHIMVMLKKDPNYKLILRKIENRYNQLEALLSKNQLKAFSNWYLEEIGRETYYSESAYKIGFKDCEHLLEQKKQNQIILKFMIIYIFIIIQFILLFTYKNRD